MRNEELVAEEGHGKQAEVKKECFEPEKMLMD